MSGVLFYLAVIACLATFIVLMIGIGGFGTGLSTPRFSNKMMRLRIIAQAVAIIFILLTVWAAKSGY